MRRRSFAWGVVAGALGCGSEKLAGSRRARREGATGAAAPLVGPIPAAVGPASAAAGPASAAADPAAGGGDALARRAEALRVRHAGRGFTVLVEAPFVVVGDEAPAQVQRRAETTIRWAVTRLRAEYFAVDPDPIVEIYLFGDRRSYLRHALELFGDEPETPYGYFSAEHQALIMNIATGGGTLVHEIVHPFIAANFPACPTWFNEGLASLYEQCGERDGRIIGRPNWRLPALQAAIRADRLPSFASLCATTRGQFYDHDPGTNYAQARYLCHYLQEQGTLRDYYHALVAAVVADPGGYATLQRVVGHADMGEFTAAWRRHVLALRFGA